MQRRIGVAALLVCCGLYGKAYAGAFQIKTSQGTLPKKENLRPLSLPRQLLKLDVSFEGTNGLSGFNNHGQDGCDPVLTSGQPLPGCDLSQGDTPSFLLTIPDGDVTKGSVAHNEVNS